MQRRTMFVALTLLPAAAAVAGPLAPPAGPVGSSMKTLQQVEPRIPISAATTPGDADSLYKITQSGSYYLTADINGVSGKSGIEIDADNVSIDLNGFTVRGVTGAKSGIIDRTNEELPSAFDVSIYGGVIESWPQHGVSLYRTNGGRLHDLTVRANGYGVRATGTFHLRNVKAMGNAWTGFETESGSVLTECTAADNHTGFLGDGTIYENCIARYNRGTGFAPSDCVLRGCTAEANSPSNIDADRCLITDCFVYTGEIGIEARYGTTVQGCFIYGASLCGIRASNANTQIIGNRLTGCGAGGAPNAAIHVPEFTDRAHIEGNTGTGNARGVYIQGTNCLVVRNSFGRPVQNHVNYIIAQGNRVASIVYAGTNATMVSTPGTSNYAGSFTTTDPNANISH